MYQGLRFPPGSIGLAAISGIEHTLWDISAQALGLPVHKMLGGNVRDKIRVYQGVHGNTPEKTAEHAQQLIEKYGYTGLKMSPYPPEPDKQLWNAVLRDGPRFIEAVRDAVGDDIDIALTENSSSSGSDKTTDIDIGTDSDDVDIIVTHTGAGAHKTKLLCTGACGTSDFTFSQTGANSTDVDLVVTNAAGSDVDITITD